MFVGVYVCLRVGRPHSTILTVSQGIAGQTVGWLCAR